MKAPKVELITTLPSDQVARKALAEYVDNGVVAEQNYKTAIAAKKNVIDIAKADLNIDPKFMRTLIKFEFDRRENAQKKRVELEGQIEQLNELDILMGRSAEEDAE